MEDAIVVNDFSLGQMIFQVVGLLILILLVYLLKKIIRN